jgi:ribosome-associated protein
VKKATGLNPRRREGMSNAEWILLDYLDVVVHVFQEPVRQFYQLEQLWADAPSEKYESD